MSISTSTAAETGESTSRVCSLDVVLLQVDNREQAKLDLELWMQEDGTRIFGSVLYSADIFDEATAQRVARHVLVSL